MSSEVSDARLVASGLSRTYRVRWGFTLHAVLALDNVGFTLEAGGVMALLGRSGSGKSTLARCLAGLETPDTGQVFLGDREITSGLPDQERSRHKVQLIFQDPGRALNNRFRAIDAVAEPILIASVGSPSERTDRAASLLLDTGVPGELHRHKVLELSGGQRRRLLIARALAADPRVMILDEALSGLDWSLQAQR